MKMNISQIVVRKNRELGSSDNTKFESSGYESVKSYNVGKKQMWLVETVFQNEIRSSSRGRNKWILNLTMNVCNSNGLQIQLQYSLLDKQNGLDK